jgi:hypothetical protein
MDMTEEELEEFKAFREMKAKKAAELAAQEKREDYKILVDETIEASIKDLLDVSNKLSEVKKKVYDNFTAVIDLKKEVILNRNYDTIRSHTFTNTEGTKRIRLGVLMLDGYADTVEDGILKVTDYITSLAKDDNSQVLVEAVLKLLAKNQEGVLKASRVIQLRKLAEQTGDEEFIEGVRIIEDAYRPTPSKTFIRADVKDERGAWKPVSLGMTEAD